MRTAENDSVASDTTSNEAIEFITALYPDDTGGCSYIWDCETKKTCWHNNMEEMAVDAVKLSQSSKIYFGVCQTEGSGESHERARYRTVAFVPGAYCDVDVAGHINNSGEHTEVNRYPSEAEALRAIASMPLPVSVVLHSGGGLYPFWLFHEPVHINADDDHFRRRVAWVLNQWEKLLQSKLPDYSLESTADLARVLRLLGMINLKYGKPVRILQPGSVDELTNVPRYSLDDLEQFLPPVPEHNPRKVRNALDISRELEIAISAATSLPDNQVDNYDSWLKLGMIFHAVDDGESGLDAWKAISERSRKYDQAACEIKWDSFSLNGNGRSVGLGTLIEQARQHGWEYPHQERPIEAVDDPYRLARLCKQEMPTLKFYRSETLEWRSPAYRVVSKPDLKSRTIELLKAEFDRDNIEEQKVSDKPKAAVKVRRGIVDDTLNVLGSICNLSDEMEAPAWLSESEPFPAKECLVTKSGILHLPSLVAGKPSFIEPTPDLFTTNAVDYEFDPKAKCPQWERFVREIWEGDHSSVEALQELFGYLLLSDTSQQKLFAMIGPKRSGKGTIARVLRQVVGGQNVAAPTLGSLQGEFGVQPLLGKTVAIVGDARLSGRTDATAIVERLLSISGEDAQTVNRKHLPQVTSQLPVRFVLLSNELPRFTDASATLPSRVILLQMTKSWFGQEDRKLTDRLLTEAPGILNWSIKGWQRLQERGYFVQPESSQEMLTQMSDIASPVKAFVGECCDVGPGLQVSVSEIFGAWKSWCESKERKPGNEQVFGRNLSAAVSSVAISRPREGNRRIRVYNGISLAN